MAEFTTTQLRFNNIAITYIGDTASIEDMINYITIHSDSSLSLSAMLTRININHIFIYVSFIKHSLTNIIPYWIIKSRIKDTGNLLTKKEFMRLYSALIPEENVTVEP